MEIRRMRPGDSRMDISRIYEESWKSAYKGIIPQTYLDSIPKGRWAPCLDQPDWHFRNGQGLFASDSTIRNVVMCFAGGALFRMGLGAISSKVLQKTSLGYKI